MAMARFFDWFQLAALAGLVGLGLGRALALYARGVRVVVIDWQRSPAQVLWDLFSVVLFLLWAYEIAAYAWPLRVHLVPAALAVVIIDAAAIKVVGVLLVIAGLAIYALALKAFGASWRIGIDRDSPGPLVTDGVFARTRNPIYVGLNLLVAGTFLIQGRLIFLALALGVAAALHEQIRQEERFLAQAHGGAYRDYCARVGRYVTWRST
jgi:protein-S-isoprenylcysteine O-methyltransferase Ste14